MTERAEKLRYEAVRDERVLALDPIARGYGFVVIETEPLQLLDWGVRVCSRKSARHCELSVGALLARYEPTAIVLEDASETRHLRRASLESFLHGLADLLDAGGPPLYSYTRGQVRTVFGVGGAVTKAAIAEALADRFPELRSRLPKPRMPWQSEDSRMSIFDALSLAVTYLATERRVREEAWRR